LRADLEVIIMPGGPELFELFLVHLTQLKVN